MGQVYCFCCPFYFSFTKSEQDLPLGRRRSGSKMWIVFDLVIKQNEKFVLSHFITSVVLPI